MTYKFLKFVIVGFSGVFIDYLITYVCKEKLKIQKYLSNSIGFLFAASSNYLFNRVWTFNSRNAEVISEFSSFILISIIGLFINNFFLFIFNREKGWGGTIAKKIKLSEKHDFSFYISKFLAIVITTIWNFLANYYITFSE